MGHALGPLTKTLKGPFCSHPLQSRLHGQARWISYKHPSGHVPRPLTDLPLCPRCLPREAHKPSGWAGGLPQEGPPPPAFPASPPTLPRCLHKLDHILNSPICPSPCWACSPPYTLVRASVLTARVGTSVPTSLAMSLSLVPSLLYLNDFLCAYIPHPTPKWGPLRPPGTVPYSRIRQQRADAVAQMVKEVECC